LSTEYNFRSAFVNGFNREDVIAYIESLQQELLNANAVREKLQADYMTARKAAENYYANLNAALAHIKTLEAQIAQLNRDAAIRTVEPADTGTPPAAVAPTATGPDEKDDEETVVIDENSLMLQHIEEKIEILLRDAGSRSETAAQTAEQIAGGYAQQTQSLIGATAESLAGLRGELDELSGKINEKLNALAEKIDALSITAAAKQEHDEDSVIPPQNTEEPSAAGFVSSLEHYASSNPGAESADDANECIVEVEADTSRSDFSIYPSDAGSFKISSGDAQLEAPAREEPGDKHDAAMQEEIIVQPVTDVPVHQNLQQETQVQNAQTVQSLQQQTEDENHSAAEPGNIPVPVHDQPPNEPPSDNAHMPPVQESLETQEDAFEFEGADSAGAAVPAEQVESARLLDLFGKPVAREPQTEGTDYSALLSENTLAAVPEENRQLTPEEIEKLMEMFPDDGENTSD